MKTGTNQAVPIGFYRQFALGAPPAPVATGAASIADDYLAQAKQLLGQKGREQEMIRLSDQVLRQAQSADAYVYRAYAKGELGDKQGAIADYNQALAINPRYRSSYRNRGIAKEVLGDLAGACADWRQAASLGDTEAAGWVRKQC